MGSQMFGYPTMDKLQSMDKLQYPEWQKLCQDALVELDKDKLRERVAAAEAAISSRLCAAAPARLSAEERRAIEDALGTLRVLKRECFASLLGEESLE